jgi:hypothetical protein
MSRYKNAFQRHSENFEKYLESVKSGEAKINASAVFPHDIFKDISNKKATEVQWNALENYLGDNKMIPMIDVSSSMDIGLSEGKLTAMDVAIATGLYIADKQEGNFKDVYLTFEDNVKLEICKGDIVQKYRQIEGSAWGGSTNITQAFDKILDVAIRNNMSDSEMPKYLVVLSDMEFNDNRSRFTEFELTKQKFAKHEYNLPKIIWWNIAGRLGNNPVKFDDNGTCMISGYSTNILKSILSCDVNNFSSLSIMDETINKERYNLIS